MNTKGLIIMMIGILSASLVFGMGKVAAVEEGSSEVKATPTVGHRYTFNDSDNAATKDEKRRILLEIIKYEPETNEDWAISENAQTQYNALNEFMALKPTKAEVEAVIDKLYSEKSRRVKKTILDFLSGSQYKDIVSAAYKKVAETDEDLFIRGLATHFYIGQGNEKEGYELVVKLFDYMDKKNRLLDHYNGVNAFKQPEMQEKIKTYLYNLRNDDSKGQAIRCYAAIICKKKYKTDLEPYFTLLEKIIQNGKYDDHLKGHIMWLMHFADPENSKINHVITDAAKKGNKSAQEILKSLKK